MKLSDAQIEYVMECLEYYTKRITSEGFRGKEKDKQVAFDLKAKLKNSQAGEWNNVCHRCAGTGFEEAK